MQFFALTYLISWGMWGTLILFPKTMGEMYFMIIFGAFGPFAAAAILSRRELGKDGYRTWLKDTFRLRDRVRWHLLGGLGLPLVIALIHIGLYAMVYGLSGLQTEPPWYYLLPALPVNVYVSVIYSSALGEEPGWQGYAMPRLLERFSPLVACLVLGVFWALWHLPLQFIPIWEGSEPLGWMLLYTTPLAIMLTWVTQKARRSVLPAIFLHQATNIYGGYLLGTDVFLEPLAANFTPIKTGIYWIIALLIVWRTGGMLGYGSRSAHPVEEPTL